MGEVCVTKHLQRLEGNSVGLLLSTFMWPLEMELTSPGLHRKSLSLMRYLTHASFTIALLYMYLIALAYNSCSINIR